MSDEKAQGEVREIFGAAKDVFAMHAVPLMLRFIATAPDYLTYLWKPMRDDVESVQFQELSTQLISFGTTALPIIYTPSSDAAGFVLGLAEIQKRELSQMTEELLRLNSIFFLFALDLREDLKTAFTQTEQLHRIDSGRDMFLHQATSNQADGEQASVSSSRMLAPLFGSNLPELPKVESFFSVVDREMERLGQTEAYLKTRVELERVGLMSLSSVPFRMQSNYKVFMQLIKDTYVAYDLLYLLTHIFPTEFPRLLLTAALMQRLLHGEKQISVQ